MSDFIPVLSFGPHEKPEDGACIMEMVSYLSGDKWTDLPACTDFIIAKIAQTVNDLLRDEERSMILSQFDRLFNTSNIDERFYLEIQNYFKNRVNEFADTNLPEKLIVSDLMELASVIRTFNGQGLYAYNTLSSLTYTYQKFMRILYRAEGAEALVKILSDVLDVYDVLYNRTEIEKQDITKIKEIQHV